MCEVELENWKRDAIAGLESALEFFSNAGKFERECWVVDQLLRSQGVQFASHEFIDAPEPFDVVFREANFQVKEVLDSDRRRHDELRKSMERAKSATDESQLLESVSWDRVPFGIAVEECLNIASTLAEQKYSASDRERMDLVFYYNRTAHSVVEPLEYGAPVDFEYRSVSVVTNSFSGVLYCRNEAPPLLRANQQRINRNAEID